MIHLTPDFKVGYRSHSHGDIHTSDSFAEVCDNENTTTLPNDRFVRYERTQET
jgi:hypothetical protein